MEINCPCPDWLPNVEKINGPIQLQSIRSGGQYRFDGKPFVFCPWCGEPLQKDRELPDA